MDGATTSTENKRMPLPQSRAERRSREASAWLDPLPHWKRLFDLVFASALLIALTPFGLVVAALIKITSRGPVFFRQRRIGLRGRRFFIWKFRTMYAETDASAHEEYVRQLVRDRGLLHKIDATRQLIPFGRMLRCLAIDELPQLFNVLGGDMSLVGPRPDVVPFEEHEPWQRGRFDVLPGMTGLWQVSGKNQTTFCEMIELDLEYVRRRSLKFDLWIVAMTIPAILRQVAVERNAGRTSGLEPTKKLPKSAETSEVC